MWNLLVLMIITVVAPTASWRNEQIISATRVERPMVGPTGSAFHNIGINHVGMHVTTNHGNHYLIHSNPSAGVVTTNAQMSKQWQTVRNIPVNTPQTVGELHRAASGIGRTGIPVVDYIAAGTCQGVAARAENALVGK